MSAVAHGLVEAGHEFAVGRACGGEVLVSFFELEAQVDDLLLELAVLLGEVAGVGGGSEAGLVPGLLAERFGQAVFELPDAAGEPERALVGGGQVGLQRNAGDALERGGDPLAAAGGAGLASLPHGLGALAASRDPGGHRVAAAAGRMAGMPSETARCRRTAVTAWSIWARSAAASRSRVCSRSSR